MASITGIVLAAGASSRMGQPKLGMRYAGATILDATVAAVVAARVDRVIVVVGPDSRIPLPTGDRPSPSIVVNPDPRRGNMSSLLTATDADHRADAFILVPGDLPTISTSAIDGMIARCLKLLPRDRYADASELLHEVRKIRESPSGAGSGPPG